MEKLVVIMKKIILFPLLITTLFVHAQLGYMGLKQSTSTYSIIIMNGESNSGGRAPNTSATAAEQLARTNTKILNNYTLGFENLQIGVNNLMLHYLINPSPNTSEHSWELGIANSVDSGTLTPPVYIVKTGQGGSYIADWAMTGSTLRFWDTLTKRVDTANKLITAANRGYIPRMYLFYTLGINDAIANTDTAVWKTKVKSYFSNLRSRYGNLPIFITYIPVAYSNFNIKITEICREISDCYPIATSDLALQADGNHWTYLSQKTIAARMIYTLKSFYNF